MRMGRVEDKYLEVVEFVKNLEDILPDDYDEYMSILEKRLACERAFEKIVEAVSDLAILIIRERGLVLPSDDEKAFDVLVGAKIISEGLALKLKDAKGMRNILAHQYDNINDEIVYEAIHDEIIKDVRDFLEVIK